MELIREALARVESAALVTIIATSGSTPRHPGAQMVVLADGTILGTIGGGRIELELGRLGAEVAAGAPARRVRHHLVRDLAMCCGGSMDAYVQPLAVSRAALAEALDRWQGRRACQLELWLDGRPAVVADLAATAARPMLDGERFILPVTPPERAILFGAGHVARALGPMLAGLGFRVVLCDDGDTGAVDTRPAWASQVVESFELVDVVRAVGGLGAGDHVIILTRDHAIDQRILEACLPLDGLAYLGLIGSRGKVGRFKKRLEAKGIATDERWARLSAPIGLELGAETPAEIAVSIAAELVRARHPGAGQ